MAMIEGFHIENFRALKNVRMGRVWEDFKENTPLKSLSVIIGKNGSGKSTLFDALGFLADCLTYGIEESCYRNGRGGIEKIHSAKQKEDIKFLIVYRSSQTEELVLYILIIGIDKHGNPLINAEQLIELDHNGEFNTENIALNLKKGKGEVWIKENYVSVELDSCQTLGISTLGHLKDHPKISAFRKFMAGWYLSYFTPDAARDIPRIGAQKHLNRDGSNLGNVVQFMEQNHPEKFQTVLDTIAGKIPGLQKIKTEPSPDGRLLIQFFSEGFDEPFYVQQVSDGTIKLFSYLLLLNDPEPPPLICIEEPENGLYHKLLEALIDEFREVTENSQNGTQLLVTTHSPHLVNALDPEEVWILEKQSDGFSTLTRASDIPEVVAMVDEGIPLGNLWFSDHIDPRM